MQFFFDILLIMSFACVQEAVPLSPHCLAVGPVLVVDDERAL